MNRTIDVEIKVGIFVLMGLSLIMVMIVMLGGASSLFEHTINLRVKLGEVEGIVDGTNIKMSGIRIGKVEKILLNRTDNKAEIHFTIDQKYQDAVRQDSTVTTKTQGVLGDRYLLVTPGTPNSAKIRNGDELSADEGKDFKDYLSSADQVLLNLKSSLAHLDVILANFNRGGRSEMFFKNLTTMSTNLASISGEMETSSARLKSILNKVDTGQGTLGALINDPGLYEDARSLMGGANRSKVLKYFVSKSVQESRDAAAQKAKQKQE